MNSMIPPARDETLTERFKRYLEEKAAKERGDPYCIAKRAFMADYIEDCMRAIQAKKVKK